MGKEITDTERLDWLLTRIAVHGRVVGLEKDQFVIGASKMTITAPGRATFRDAIDAVMQKEQKESGA